ncbi:hypothetical protein [Kiloniella sp.]|uniref:hypothetical protein n=1 Tax=Kiloniella sp. TaxID=1938587 RepID=UPI003B011F11
MSKKIEEITIYETGPDPEALVRFNKVIVDFQRVFNQFSTSAADVSKAMSRLRFPPLSIPKTKQVDENEDKA